MVYNKTNCSSGTLKLRSTLKYVSGNYIMLAREYMKGRQEGTFPDHRDHSTTLDYCELLLHFFDYCYNYFYSAVASCESSTQTNCAEHV